MRYGDGYCRYRGVVHGLDAEGCYTLCGAGAHALVLSSGVRADVTCKRCLASLAKRDREFRRKARRWFAAHTWHAESGNYYVGATFDSARYAWGPATFRIAAKRAIAAEEGRS